MVIVLNMKAIDGLSKLAALVTVIKIHKQHNKTTIWCQFEENTFNSFLNYKVEVHLNFKTISGLSKLPVLLIFIKIHHAVAQQNKLRWKSIKTPLLFFNYLVQIFFSLKTTSDCVCCRILSSSAHSCLNTRLTPGFHH